MELPDGTRLVGRGGTIPSWVVYVVLSPLLLIYNVLGLLGGYGRPDWFLPARIAWRTRGGLGLASLKFYGTTDRYKARMEGLDPRLAYAQDAASVGPERQRGGPSFRPTPSPQQTQLSGRYPV